MYGAVDAVVCILSEDGDDRSVLCCDEGGCIDKRESIEFVIVNTCYVDKTLVCVGYASQPSIPRSRNHVDRVGRCHCGRDAVCEEERNQL